MRVLLPQSAALPTKRTALLDLLLFGRRTGTAGRLGLRGFVLAEFFGDAGDGGFHEHLFEVVPVGR